MKIFQNIKNSLQKNIWINVNDIPIWVDNKLRNSSKEINYYKGKTFIYKALKLPGKIQGEYNYKVYRRLKKF